MRHELIEALTYPRLLVQKLVDARDCPHDNLFEATSERCHQCDINRECHWVSCLNDFSNFEGKENHTINASFATASNLLKRCTANFDMTRRLALANLVPGCEMHSA